jgi:hypothetical protein
MNAKQDKPQGNVELDKDPTAEEEEEFFETADERRQKQRDTHALAVLDRNLGWIGRYTGSTNAPLNIASAILVGLFAALFLCLGGAAYSGLASVGNYIERLIAAILTVSGFVFGRVTSR